MNIIFICKASTKIGLGHLIRSRTLALQLKELKPDYNIKFILIGDQNTEKLISQIQLDYSLYSNEYELSISKKYDISFFDMLSMSHDLFENIANKSRLTVSLSPIFDRMDSVELLFSRTSYQNSDLNTAKHIYKGLEYSIIQEDCHKIKTDYYKDNIASDQFPIAISMGGGDAPNKTLAFLKSLKKCRVPVTFWVMLGEGYKHSYDELIKVNENNHLHEIILCKTNRSMWHILKNCSMVILPGGITTYEAAYAGLPSINVLNNEKSYFLLKELEENGVCNYLGIMNENTLAKLNNKIEYYYKNRNELLQMHLNSKTLITNRGGAKILEKCLNHLMS